VAVDAEVAVVDTEDVEALTTELADGMAGATASLVELAGAERDVDVCSSSGEVVGITLSDVCRAVSVGETDPPYSHPSPSGIDGP
jgi:hypothetical protein